MKTKRHIDHPVAKAVVTVGVVVSSVAAVYWPDASAHVTGVAIATNLIWIWGT